MQRILVLHLPACGFGQDQEGDPLSFDMDHDMVHVYGPANSPEAEMRISVTEAKGQLTDLVRRSEMGDDVVLTRHGQPVVRLVPVKVAVDRAARRELLESVRASGGRKASRGPSAARSQDFLYDKHGLPK